MHITFSHTDCIFLLGRGQSKKKTVTRIKVKIWRLGLKEFVFLYLSDYYAQFEMR